MTAWNATLGNRFIRGRRAFPLMLVVGALPACLSVPAHAEDLPALLVAAAKLMPATEEGRTRCSVISAVSYMANQEIPAPPASSLNDDREYDASTQGAYLEQTAAGKAPMPLSEALLEAGVALRYRMRVPERVQVPNPVHGNGLSIWAEQVQARTWDIIVATGPDAALFPKIRPGYQLTRVPVVNGGANENGEPLGSAAVTPSGVWVGDRLCLTGVPVQVLEYGDVQTRQNGLRFVTAAILFRPERAPNWLADPRIMRSLYRALPLQEVRFIGFRDDGDGWRPTLVADPFFIEKKTHVVAED